MTFPGTSCPEKSLTICVACSPRNPQKSRDSRPHVRRSEHGATLLVPLLFPQTVLDAPLAIPQPFLYPGLHLKYLRAERAGDSVAKPIPSERPRYFKFFCWSGPSPQGETLVLGLVQVL